MSEPQVPAGEPAGTDPRAALGRIFHEQGRLTVNAERAKPFGVEGWDLRTAEQQEIDMRGAAAVAAEALRGYEAERTELTLARLSRSATIARITSLCRRHLRLEGSCCPHLAEEILAITGSEEADRG